MSTATHVRITAAEFLARDYGEQHVQLVDGEVIVTSPTDWHNELIARIAERIRAWVRQGPDRGHAIFDVDHHLDEHNVFRPDVFWHARPRASTPGWYHRAPELAVEVRSPSTWRVDVGPKLRVYEARGARELWLVDHPAETVLVFRRSSPKAPTFDVSLELVPGDTLTTPLLPGLALSVAELFAR